MKNTATIKVIKGIAEMRRFSQEARKRGAKIALVPTMGALHEGHLALISAARQKANVVVVSIFVNPLQFGPTEDYTRYPRPMRRDLAILRAAGSDVLYLPDARRLYPPDYETRVSVLRLREPLDGASRPGHFDGVATVVAKLLIGVEPDRLYLGQKDAQQAVVLRRLVRDLDFAVRVVVCPTIRERDGLATSSRNAYLSPVERAWAPILYAVLRDAAARVRSGEIGDPHRAEALMRRRLSAGPGRLDYAAAVDSENLGPAAPGRPWLLAVAYRLSSARLIDNVIVRPRRRGR